MKLFEETYSTSKEFRLSILVLLMALLVLTWLLRMNYWDQPFQMDEGVYSYVGWGLLEDLVPYKDVFDHKPPGIYVLYFLAFLLFKPTALSVKLFATIYTLGTVLAIFFLARKLAGATAGCLAALLFGIFSSGPRIEGGGVNTEIFMVLPYTLAAYSLLRAVETKERKQYLLFGLWTGLASTIKQVAMVNLFWVGAYLLVCIWRAKNRKAVAHVLGDIVLVAFGTTLAWLPYCLYFYLKDALHYFYYWQVSFNLDYIAEGHGAVPNLAVFWHQTKNILCENGILWLLALSGIFWQWQELRKSKVLGLESSTSDQQASAWFLMSIWPFFSFLGVSLGGHFYGHYYIQIIPSLAVLGGVGLVKLARRVRVLGIEILRSPISLVLTLLFVKALLLFVITDAPYYLSYNADQISFHQYHTPLFSVTRFIGKYLQQRTQPDELVYVWATNPEINFYALRKTPNPYLVQRRESRISIEEVIQSLQKSPPKYIVVIDEMKRFPQLQDYIRQNYQEETDTELEDLKKLLAFNVYRREEG